jgi:serine/threonine-protein kinase
LDDLTQRLTDALAGRYVVVRGIGEGGMASVFLAHDLRHDREVAIKVLREDIGVALGAERFLREIKVAARLQHPHILPLFDSGEASGLLFYVMPYVPGESLRQRLQRERMLPVEDAQRIAREVADALAFAHAAGVVHRDIKPENILLTGDHAVVADFGIARAITESGGNSLTGVGLTLGTPAYMSPEQAGGETVDGRSDIYALGCVLYEMLAGDVPFRGPTVESVVQQHLAATPIPVESRRTSVPVVTSAIVRRCLAKEPADRFANASELAGALAHTGVATPAAPLPVRKPAGRVTWVLLTGAVGLAATGAVWFLRRPTPSAAGPEEPPSVAILRCASNAPGAEEQFLSDGITQEIIARLAQVQNLKVISGSSVIPLSSAGLTLPQIADTLGVRYVLECTVSRTNDRIRVFGQLVDASTSAVRWARPFEGLLADKTRIEDDVARQVVGALSTETSVLRAPSTASRTTVPAAAAALLEGNYQLHRRSPEAIRAAIGAYIKAIQLDSGFAPAYAALGAAYGLALTYQADFAISPYEVYARGLILTSRALDLDSTIAEAYAARAYIATKAFGPSGPIAEDIRHALKYSPNSADVHGWYAHYLSREGRHDEALVEAERAIALDPIAPGRRVGFALDAVGAARFDLAVREADHAAALEPTLESARGYGALAALGGGDANRCLAFRPSRSVQSTCLRALGRAAEARHIADSLAETVPGGGTEPLSGGANARTARDLTTFYALAGDAPQATQWLQRAFEASPNAIDFRILGSTLYDRVRKHPAFSEALNRIRSETWARTDAARSRITLVAALTPP